VIHHVIDHAMSKHAECRPAFRAGRIESYFGAIARRVHDPIILQAGGAGHPVLAIEAFGTPALYYSEMSEPQIERLRTISRVLDTAFSIPGTRFRFGLDAIIGLVPGVGDIIGGLFSTYIIFKAARLGAPKATLTRMVVNTGIDTLVGEIPLLGDLFDFGFKSNIRNMALLEDHLQRPVAATAQSRRVLLLLGAGLLAILVGAVALGVVAAQLVLRALH
jgi:hypothetical protein